MKDQLKEKLLASKPMTMIPVTPSEMKRIMSGEMDEVIAELQKKPCDCPLCILEKGLADMAGKQPDYVERAQASLDTEPAPEREQSFEEVVRPLMKWLADNYHPHCKVIVESDRAELIEGQQSYVTKDFIKD